MKTLLVVDDNDDIRTLMAHQLQAKGYRILMASHGQQAIDIAKESKPDLILMDVLMPGKDGTEASITLKENPQTQNIPVIFLTALVHGYEDGQGEVLTGSDIVLSKSTPLDELVHRIESLLKGKAT